MRMETTKVIVLAVLGLLLAAGTADAKDNEMTASTLDVSLFPVDDAGTYSGLSPTPQRTHGVVKMAIDDFALFLGGMFQIQMAPFVGDEALLQHGDQAEQEGFRARRARFKMRAFYDDLFSFGLTLNLLGDIDEGSVFYEGYVGIHLHEAANIYLGAHKFPYSRSMMTSSAELQFISRPLAVEAMSPERQLGVLLTGGFIDNRIKYFVGVYNSLERGQTFHSGYKILEYEKGNRIKRLVYAGRLEFHPLGELSPGIADVERQPFGFALGGGYFYNDGTTREIHATSADLHLKYAGLSLLSEFLLDYSEPVATPITTVSDVPVAFKRMAFYGQLGYVLPWLPLEFAVRLEYIDDNTKIDDEGDELVVMGGTHLYVFENRLKFQLDYVHRTERYGASILNDSLIFQTQVDF